MIDHPQKLAEFLLEYAPTDGLGGLSVMTYATAIQRLYSLAGELARTFRMSTLLNTFSK
jgi:hypothetical protein